MRIKSFKGVMLATSLLIISVMLLVNFSGCRSHENGSVVRIEEFVKQYSKLATKLDVSLLNVSMRNADVFEDSHGKTYNFALVTSFAGKTAEMVVVTDKNDCVKAINVRFSESALNTFENPEELVNFYAVVVDAADAVSKRSTSETADIIIDIWNQSGDLRTGSVGDVGDITLYMKEEGILEFSLMLFEQDEKNSDLYSEKISTESEKVDEKSVGNEEDFSTGSSGKTEKAKMKGYEPCPFDKDEMTKLSVRTNWYDNGIFSSFFENTIANAEWEYVGTMLGNINPNPYDYSGYDVYVVGAWDYMDHEYSLFLVPYSEYVAAPNVYAYDENTHKMKLVWIDGEVYGDGEYEWSEGYYSNEKNDDPIVGNYEADYPDVRLSVVKKGDKYYLSYMAGDKILSGIPELHVEKNEENTSVFFVTDEMYPEHKGYVELSYKSQGVTTHMYNSEIEGVAHTYGDYVILYKQ